MKRKKENQEVEKKKMLILIHNNNGALSEAEGEFYYERFIRTEYPLQLSHGHKAQILKTIMLC